MNEVVNRFISELKPHPRNYNKHSDRQIDDLALSLKKFGQRKPIVTWRNMIVAGHGLTMAAQMAGWSTILTMPIPDDWDEATVLAYLAADNELARQADPDLAQLAAITKELEGIDEELAKLAAGGDDALKALMATIEDEKPNGDAEPQVDKAEELRQKWDVQSGQMWQLGEHRIICGDCTDRAVVERVMGGEKWNCIVTDPPYGVDYEGGRNPDSNKPREKLHGDGDALLYADFLNLWMDYRQDKSVVYMWFADKRGISVFNAVESVGLTVRAMIIWNKVDAHYGNFMAQYMQKHEPCLYCVKDSTEWYGATNEVTVWDIKQPTINEFHPTQKPIECMAKPITNSTKIGDIVAEPFSGSGTTLIACENLSRKCRAVEISPAYVAVAIQRWVDVTGKEPILL